MDDAQTPGAMSAPPGAIPRRPSDMAMPAPGAGPNPGAPPGSNAPPPNQLPGSTGFRRQRASRACETCHARKVRCDAASLGVPCTNCVAFNIECKIPSPKRKKTGSKAKDSDSERGDSSAHQTHSPANTETSLQQPVMPRELPSRDKTQVYNTPDGLPSTVLPEQYLEAQRSQNGTYAQYMKPKFARAPIKEAGRVAYLGESSNLSLLVHDQHGTTDVVHYPLPETTRGTRARITELDDLEIRILHERGAFLLPPRQLCDELVEDFFTWIAPVVPVINRSRFMRRYRDTKNPPSLLLLQAILLAGSRVCSNPQLMDANGSTTPAAMTFYKRAKALYDANYEDDRVTIVQALILMGWYWEGPEDVTKNVFYWSRVAIIVAQGSGMHRSVENSQLSSQDKRLWKRIWWTLFTRDRSVAVALGRPVGINIDDSDVEMVCEDDFIEDEPDKPAEYKPDPIHVQFFLNYVKLCEIMGLVLSQNYAVGTQKAGRIKAIDLTHSDMALADWLANCPKEVYWERSRHHFWAALLHSNYYTTLCLLHRAHMPPAGSAESKRSNGYPEETAYPSRNIAYQAAGMITSIVEALNAHDQLRYTPAFIVYSLFSALIMHVYQMRSSNQTVVETTQTRLTVCMNALKDVSKVWLVAKMVHTLFESILGNKHLEERLQRAAGKRHARSRPNAIPVKVQAKPDPPAKPQPQKRKFDDIEMGFSGGQPAAQMSYERSRPVSPVNELSRDANQQQPIPLPHPHISTSSPPLRQAHDAFMGMSRSGTRQTTPFNTYSYPGTPPDFFLHTRNSPNISQDLWQNYQPDQLFPPDAAAFSLSSPTQQMVDPALRGPAPTNQYAPQANMQTPMQQMPPNLQSQQSQHLQAANGLQALAYQQGNPASWAHMQQSMEQGSHRGSTGGPGPEDTWSNSSTGPIVPTTLNVGDWFEFFGIPNNGELSGLHGQF